MNLMIDQRHIWNVQYNARSNRSHPPTSPNTVPGKMNLMIDPRHIWDVIYNARSKRCHPPTSPNTAATKFWVQDVSGKSLNCFRQYKDDSTMIRPWNRHLAPAASETLLDALSPKISRNAAPATKSDAPTSPHIAPATKNESHDWSASHLNRPLQCAEQVKSPSYSCHEVLSSRFERAIPELFPPI